MVLPASAEGSSPHQTLVRISVVGATSRADLALPGTVPVISMVAGLIHLLGGEPTESHLLVTTTGAVLEPDVGLLGQGIRDGAILTLAPVYEHVPQAAHDDVVVAVHSLSRDEFRSWDLRSAKVSSRVASTWLLGLGAVLLAAVGTRSPEEGLVAGVLAGAAALALLIVVAAHRRQSSAPPGPDWQVVAAVWFACLYAAIAGDLVATTQGLGPGRLAATDGSPLGAVLWAALSALVAAVLACVLLRRNRVLVAPVIALAALVVAGTLTESWGLMEAQHCLVLLATVWILAARGAPGLVMEATALRHPGAGERDWSDVADGVDTERLRSALLASNDLVLAVSLTSFGFLLVAVPTATSSGWVGVMWLLALTSVLALRLRRDRLRGHVVAGLVGMGLVVTSVVGSSPRLPPLLVLLLAGTALCAGLLTGVTEGRINSLRAGWLGDRAEVLLTAAGVPLSLLLVWPSLMPGG